MRYLALIFALLLPVTASAENWSYGGAEDGSANWGKLDPSYMACDDGVLQSPINLKPNFEATALPLLEVFYSLMPMSMVNTGNVLYVKVSDDHSIKLGDNEFKLKRFSFHSPSEHEMKGKSYAMEIQFEHTQEAEAEPLMLSVMVEEGEFNPYFDKLLSYAPRVEGKKRVEKLVDPMTLIPEQVGYIHYRGSYSRPPCTDNVPWYVMLTPVQASAEQIKDFRSILSSNVRPIQPSHNRLIITD